MITVGKQDQLPYTHQKTDFRIVLETNSATSSNTEGSGQKQADTPTHSNAAHATVTPIRTELHVQQSESNPANRSETFHERYAGITEAIKFRSSWRNQSDAHQVVSGTFGTNPYRAT